MDDRLDAVHQRIWVRWHLRIAASLDMDGARMIGWPTTGMSKFMLA